MIADNSIDLIITSPPQKIIETQLDELLSILARIIKDNGWILIDKQADFLEMMQPTKTLKISESVENAGLHIYHPYFLRDAYLTGSDQIIYAIAAQSLTQVPTTATLTINWEREASHECEFCPELIKTLITTYSDAGAVVLDPFCGTGIVPGVADENGRLGIGCDLKPHQNILPKYTVSEAVKPGEEWLTVQQRSASIFKERLSRLNTPQKAEQLKQNFEGELTKDNITILKIQFELFGKIVLLENISVEDAREFQKTIPIFMEFVEVDSYLFHVSGSGGYFQYKILDSVPQIN